MPETHKIVVYNQTELSSENSVREIRSPRGSGVTQRHIISIAGNSPLISLRHHSRSPIFVLRPKFGCALFIFCLNLFETECFEAFKAVRLVSDSPVGTEVCDQVVVIVLVDAKKRPDLAILLAGCSSEFDQRIGDIERNQPESR